MKIEAANARNYLNHCISLAKLAGKPEYEGFEIYAKLLRLENKASSIRVRECNEGNFNGENQIQRITDQVQILFPDLKTFFCNGDPRGYTLKIKEDEVHALRTQGIVIHTDFGGYGILAPEY